MIPPRISPSLLPEAGSPERRGLIRRAAQASRIIAGLAWAEPDPQALREAVAGQRVLVTGASSGIGEASARRLAAAGAKVLLVARREPLLQKLAGEVRSMGGDVVIYVADLSDVDQVEALVAAVISDHGGVDIVINNAGRSIRRPIDESYDRFHDYTRTIDLNYLGPVRLLLGLLPEMRRQGHGQIINVSTIGLDMPGPRWSAYAASKGAFEIWLQCVAPEARLDGVTATSIHFGLVRTAMSAPTRVYRHLPSTTAQEAAAAVCRAVLHHPRVIRPWWARSSALCGQLAPGLTERVQALSYRQELRIRARRRRRKLRSGGIGERQVGAD